MALGSAVQVKSKTPLKPVGFVKPAVRCLDSPDSGIFSHASSSPLGEADRNADRTINFRLNRSVSFYESKGFSEDVETKKKPQTSCLRRRNSRQVEHNAGCQPTDAKRLRRRCHSESRTRIRQATIERVSADAAVLLFANGCTGFVDKMRTTLVGGSMNVEHLFEVFRQGDRVLVTSSAVSNRPGADIVQVLNMDWPNDVKDTAVKQGLVVCVQSNDGRMNNYALIRAGQLLIRADDDCFDVPLAKIKVFQTVLFRAERVETPSPQNMKKTFQWKATNVVQLPVRRETITVAEIQKFDSSLVGVVLGGYILIPKSALIRSRLFNDRKKLRGKKLNGLICPNFCSRSAPNSQTFIPFRAISVSLPLPKGCVESVPAVLSAPRRSPSSGDLFADLYESAKKEFYEQKARKQK